MNFRQIDKILRGDIDIKTITKIYKRVLKIIIKNIVNLGIYMVQKKRGQKVCLDVKTDRKVYAYKSAYR